MYLIYHEFGKARLADLHAQAERDALAGTARRARRERRPPSVPRRPLPGQLQSWRVVLCTLAGSIASPIVGWFARAVRRGCTPGWPADGERSRCGTTRLAQTVASAGAGSSARSEEMGQAGRKPDDPVRFHRGTGQLLTKQACCDEDLAAAHAAP